MKEVHVSSLMIYVAKEDLNPVADVIKTWQGADLVRLDRNEGKLTAVLETESMKRVRMVIAAFEKLEGVAQVVLLFHNVITAGSKHSEAEGISA